MTRLSEMEPNDRSGLTSPGDEDVGLVLLGVEGRILEVCPNAERILGCNASVFRGQRIEDVLRATPSAL